MRGKCLVGISAANRAASGIAEGDVVEVDLKLDTEPRVVPEPPDLARALNDDPEARAASTAYHMASSVKTWPPSKKPNPQRSATQDRQAGDKDAVRPCLGANAKLSRRDCGEARHAHRIVRPITEEVARNALKGGIQ